MSLPEISIAVTYARLDGVVVSRTVRVTQSAYGQSPVGDFKRSAKRRGIEAINSVLGTPKDLTVKDGD